MPDALQTALGLARRWRQANGNPAPGGVVLVLDGQFVGFLDTLPSPAEWAPGCLAVAADGGIHLARPAGFRGEVEWADLGVFSFSGDEAEPPPPSAVSDLAQNDRADEDIGSPPEGENPSPAVNGGVPASPAAAGPATPEHPAPDSP